ncbi:GbsR/MarR family transcriptional regulator [Methanobacterium alcaliphilum]|uniref:GbsR/MarR family transcriptional regulator n=1 Tax=Methanobacterium alcaliphilum TaxID=392018 RepID=UPI00200B0657|nr:MarR family transcriptional regulator [Methanobacterium alcaliphilum]MCK9150456.1 winged helix-turn-helix transcriptional regulator [Methanobacterium alcaliphilum]
MSEKEALKEEFKELVYRSFRALGLEDFPSKLMSTLLSEPKEISLGELSEMTGYSLSALSTSLKAMEDRDLVKRFKKPKSRKVYVVMDKDVVTLYMQLQKKRYDQSLMPTLRKTPKLIEKFQSINESNGELELLEDFYQQMIFLEEESRKFIESLEKWREI